MIRVTKRPIGEHDNARAVRAAIQRIQRAVRATRPDELERQPGAWLLSWPCIGVVWCLIGLIYAGRCNGWIS